MKNIEDSYFKIDGLMNAFDSLKRTKFFLSQLDDPFRWKWSVISSIHSLYSFMIEVLEFGNFERVIDFDRSPKKVIEAIEKSNDDYYRDEYIENRQIIEEYIHSGKANLISFKEAINRIQDRRYFHLSFCSGPIEIKEKELNNILKLRYEFRNPFEHFKPTTWYIEQNYFLPLITDTLNVLKRLLNINFYIFNDNITLKDCNNLFDDIEQKLIENSELFTNKKGAG